jgi:hypothetical protein
MNPQLFEAVCAGQARDSGPNHHDFFLVSHSFYPAATIAYQNKVKFLSWPKLLLL